MIENWSGKTEVAASKPFIGHKTNSKNM